LRRNRSRTVSVNLAYGTGRRKTAVARVFLRAGNGTITVNGKTVEDFFRTPEFIVRIKNPLLVTDSESKYDVLINVKGGGVSGQAAACLLGLSRALASEDPNNYKPLRANGYMTRDARMVERKKYGQRGARRKFQFSKR